MQADKHESPIIVQFTKKIQHKTDVTVLGVELRLVEQMNQRIRGAGGLEHERRTCASEMTHLIGLMVMNGQAIAIAVFYLMDIMSQAKHLATVRAVASGDEFKKGRLTRAVRSHQPDNSRRCNGKIGFQLKRHLFVQQTASIHFAKLVDNQKRRPIIHGVSCNIG